MSRQAAFAFAITACFLVTGTLLASEKAEHPHWGYEGEGGPGHWGHLEPSFEKCESGRAQSPVDLAGAAEKDMAAIDFSYKDVPLEVVDNGHTIQVNIAKGSSAGFRGESYNLLQFHFHSPSEHILSGKPYPMELHLVHADADGRLAVVGLFIKEGEAHPSIATVWSHLPVGAGETSHPDSVTINPETLFAGEPLLHALLRLTDHPSLFGRCQLERSPDAHRAIPKSDRRLPLPIRQQRQAGAPAI